jgi:hypothetical protein
MNYTREQWSRSLLASIGNTNPTKNVVDFVVAWTILESAPGRASYNLLNTRHQLGIPGTSSNFNSVGVQSFSAYSYGIIANRNALNDGFYPALLQALKVNDETALGFTSGTPSSDILSELSTWCGGCGYGTKLLGLIGDPRTADLFPGDVQTVPVQY